MPPRYGADQVMESFKDYDSSGLATDQARYLRSMLTYVGPQKHCFH